MPTALELSREEWQKYIDSGVRRGEPAELTPEERETRQQLLETVREAAAVLKSRFGAKRVILFGSLAHAAWFMPDSDVDLVVEGLALKDYWQAWKAIEEIISDRPVDLIEIEAASDSLRRAIERHGIEL